MHAGPLKGIESRYFWSAVHLGVKRDAACIEDGCATPTGRRSARLAGFSLHADVAVPARRRDQLERLCRYLLRPPLAVARLTESSGGQLVYQFRRPWRDGSTAHRYASAS